MEEKKIVMPQIVTGHLRDVIVMAVEDILNKDAKEEDPKHDGNEILAGIETRVTDYYVRTGIGLAVSKLAKTFLKRS